MKRVTINALVDIGCVIMFIPWLITGLVLYFFLPSGGGRGGSCCTGRSHGFGLPFSGAWILPGN
jgi:hypothetical protein